MIINPTQSDEQILLELGSRIAQLRIAKNLTQAALATEAGISKRTLQRLEGGEVAAQLTALIRVLRTLGLMDRLELLLPTPLASPIQQLEMKGKLRQRSRKKSSGTEDHSTWTWGDDDR